MEKQKIVISADLGHSLAEAIAECQPDRLFALADETTARLCLPLAGKCEAMREAGVIPYRLLTATRRWSSWHTCGPSWAASGPRATRCW